MSEHDTDKTPKYLRLKRVILEAARKESWTEGYRLPTENEFAQRYSVSRSTVRQTLNELEGEGLLSRQRGRGTFYTPIAKGPERRHNLIGITTSLLGYIYPAIVRGAEEALSERGYHSVVGTNLLSEEVRKNIESDTNPWRLDGLLFEPNADDRPLDFDEVIDRVKAFGMPFVMLNWTSHDPEVSWIAPDDVAAGEKIATYLLERGHRRVAFVGEKRHQPTVNRLKGFTNGFADAGIELSPEYLILEEWRAQQHRYTRYYEATKKLLETARPLPSAIFFFSDHTAAQGYHAIKDAGLRIPDDISVISYDDSELGRVLNPRLTTMVHPKEELGRWAARLLVDLIERPEQQFTHHFHMQSKIIERDSVRRV